MGTSTERYQRKKKLTKEQLQKREENLRKLRELDNKSKRKSD